jgi:exodeoxyribonuclease-3
VKIATFNINNINRRLPNLLNWLSQATPDVVCLQELKAEDRASPKQPFAMRDTGPCGGASAVGMALLS